MSGAVVPREAAQTSPAVVAIAASAGGLKVLTQILSELPADFGAPILIVMHLSPHHESLLPGLLNSRTTLSVRQAVDGELMEPGSVYVGPRDRHLRVDLTGRVLLADTAPVHYSRPAADELFRSVAEAYGARAIGVICSGGGLDGSSGLAELHDCGGTTIAQDRDTSEHYSMPGEAVRIGAADMVLPLSQIAGRLLALVGCRQPPSSCS
jgi:two-component system, chemotaxis family, protein-glutamate methylesterase/glutaminase